VPSGLDGDGVFPVERCKNFDQHPNLGHICGASGFCLQNGLSVQMLALHEIGADLKLVGKKKPPNWGLLIRGVILKGVFHTNHSGVATEEAINT